MFFISLLLLQLDAWVERSANDIRDNVHCHHTDGQDDERALQDWIILLADGLIMVMIYRTCFTADDQYRPPEAR